MPPKTNAKPHTPASTASTAAPPEPENDDEEATGADFDFIPGVSASDFEAQRTGTFPPYWKPDEEALNAGQPQGFVAQVLDYDARNPDFKRWVMLAKCDLLCHTGPAADGEEVHVKDGEEFSISDFYGLDLSMYLGLTVFVRAKDKIDLKKSAHTLWRWQLGVHKKDLPTLTARRQAAIAEGRQAPKRVVMPATTPAAS